jgi:HIRAN domain
MPLQVATLTVGVILGLLLAAFIGGRLRARARTRTPLNEREPEDWRDNPNVVQVNEHAPPGFAACLAWEARVAGISYHERDAESFVLGTAQQLDLVREPSNPVDKNAVSVFGTWTDSTGERYRRKALGHLPREIAAMVAALGPDAEIAAALRIMFTPMEGKGAGIRLNVWSKEKIPRLSRRRKRLAN